MSTPETFTGTTSMGSAYATEAQCAAADLLCYVTADGANVLADALDSLDDMGATLAEMANDGWRCHTLTVAEPDRIAALAITMLAKAESSDITLHADGTVEWWSCLIQGWHRSDHIADCELATFGQVDRMLARRHLGDAGWQA